MKLDKSDLFFIFNSVDALSEKGSYQAETLAEEAYSALYHDELEIEGYQRAKWIKFNPNDPKTFPTKNGNYLVVYFDEIRIVEWYNTYFIEEGSKSYVFSDCVSYWMPSPEMPNKK